jgi:hypothetical protein
MDPWERADEEKLAELMLSVAGKIADDPTGGTTKINHLLFLAEFSHVRANGFPITGVPYVKFPQGPAPARLVPIRDGLIGEGSAELRTDQYFGRALRRLVPTRDADEGRFGDSERKVVDQVIAALWGRSAAEASKISRREVGWRVAGEGEEIPFSAAFLDGNDAVTETSRRHAEGLLAQLDIAN